MSWLARLGKLLGLAVLVWAVLAGAPSLLGFLLAGGRLPPGWLASMLALWGFVAAPVLVFGMSAPVLRTRPRAWSTVPTLLRINLATATLIGPSYAALMWLITGEADRLEDALVVYALATLVYTAAIAVIAMAEPRRSSEQGR